MTLQLVDNLWELKLENIFDATVQKYFLGNFVSPYIVVHISSDSADLRWQQAGSLGQAVDLDQDLAYGEVKEVSLNNHLLLEFAFLGGENYQLYYFPLPRLIEVKVKIWEYQGTTQDTEIIKLISALESFEFPTIKEAIVKTKNNCLPSTIEGNPGQEINKNQDSRLYDFLL